MFDFRRIPVTRVKTLARDRLKILVTATVKRSWKVVSYTLGFGRGRFSRYLTILD